MMNENQTRNGHEQRRILIVEDNRAIAQTIQILLHQEGYDTRWCQDESLYELVEEWHPDLILMDLKMPKLDGGVATLKLKSNPTTSTIPVIMITAEQVSTEALASIRANDLVPKPFMVHHLLDRVRYWIATRAERLGNSMNGGLKPAL